MIALGTKQRNSILKDVPTVAESVPGYEVGIWYGLMAPAGTPEDILTKLSREQQAIVNLPDVRDRLAAQGFESFATSPATMRSTMKSEMEKWAKVIKDAGIKSWLHHLLGGAPWYMFPIMVPIELISLFTKPFALMIRLFANMTAGHIVLMSLVGLIFFFKSWMVTPVSVAFSVFIYLLELLVAFLQAYIFAMLASVFVGLALGDHAKDDHHGDAHAH